MSQQMIERLILIGGILHVSLFGVVALVPKTLDWRGELAKVHPFVRRLMWVYSAYIVLNITAFAAASLLLTSQLASGETLARAVCGLVAIFWAVRVAVALFVFDARPFLRNSWMKVGYHTLTLVFVYLALAYGAAACRNPRPERTPASVRRDADPVHDQHANLRHVFDREANPFSPQAAVLHASVRHVVHPE